MQRKRTRSARKLIYQLKKVCGFSITLCRPASSSYDFETGEERIVTTFKIIRKVILLPSELKTEEDRIREDERDIVIDYQDIKVFGVEINDIILFDSRAWRVSKIKNHELDTIRLVRVKNIAGASYINPLEPDISSILSSTQTVVKEVI